VIGYMWSENADSEAEAQLRLTGMRMLADAEFPGQDRRECVEFCILRNCWIAAVIVMPEVIH
jgi:hypothetical protein